MTDRPLPELVENPKLTLYAFHLCHDMASAEGQRVEDGDRLWENFAKLGQELAIEPLATWQQWLNLPEHGGTVEFRELLSEEIGRCLRFPFSSVDADSETPEPRRNGELYALQIHDSYAADLTFRYSSKVSINDLKNLNPQGKLLPDRIQASLGQTLVLFAKPIVNDTHPETLRQVADRCLNALLAEADPKWQNLSYLGDGKLLNSPIFEYSNFIEDPAQSCHVIIWLDCHLDTTNLEAEGDYYHPLINLLCSRWKICFSYYQARDRYREAKAAYHELENQTKALNNLPSDMSERLTYLKESLLLTNRKTFTYASYIRDIEDHRTTLITNFKNYTIFLKHINQVSGDHQLTCLQHFSDSRSKFLGQIHTDLHYLRPGKVLFRQYIATLRGIVEVEQAEIDRDQQQTNQDLQNRIQAVGVGIAAGAIVASTSGLITEPWQLPNRDRFWLPPHPFVVALFWSIFCSVGAWWLVEKWMSEKLIFSLGAWWPPRQWIQIKKQQPTSNQDSDIHRP
ncbi:MAG: hypothetical protein ACLFQ7_15700 [Phormidium sp.]